jgi:hypothetical protein
MQVVVVVDRVELTVLMHTVVLDLTEAAAARLLDSILVAGQAVVAQCV